MEALCEQIGHKWGEWSDWQEKEQVTGLDWEDGVVVRGKYIRKQERRRYCGECNKLDQEVEHLESKILTSEEYYSKKEDGEIDSLQAHLDAKNNSDYPVSVGDYVTAGIEEFSKHYDRGDEPIIKHKAFVIFIKAAPEHLELGDVITVRISSFNEGDSSNGVFIREGDNE